MDCNTNDFRMWCQTVLPLVYDDSLSYYEQLCKITEYLNNTLIELDAIVDQVDENTGNINSAKAVAQEALAIAAKAEAIAKSARSAFVVTFSGDRIVKADKKYSEIVNALDNKQSVYGVYSGFLFPVVKREPHQITFEVFNVEHGLKIGIISINSAEGVRVEVRQVKYSDLVNDIDYATNETVSAMITALQEYVDGKLDKYLTLTQAEKDYVKLSAVDNHLSETSIYPVQNLIVTKKLKEKADVKYVDALSHTIKLESIPEITDAGSLRTYLYERRKDPKRCIQLEISAGNNQNVMTALGGFPYEGAEKDSWLLYLEWPYTEAGGFMIVATLEGRTNGKLFVKKQWGTLNANWKETEWIDQRFLPVTVDPELSDTSKNPVENQAVTKAIKNIGIKKTIIDYTLPPELEGVKSIALEIPDAKNLFENANGLIIQTAFSSTGTLQPNPTPFYIRVHDKDLTVYNNFWAALKTNDPFDPNSKLYTFTCIKFQKSMTNAVLTGTSFSSMITPHYSEVNEQLGKLGEFVYGRLLTEYFDFAPPYLDFILTAPFKAGTHILVEAIY